MNKKRRSSSLAIAPAMDLREHARGALSGAKYHYAIIKKMVTSFEKTLGADKRSFNELHWHLRAFFWELVAAFETARTCLIMEKKSHINRNTELKEIIESSDSDWYQEIKEWRNFAHRAFLFVQGEFDGDDGRLKFLYLPQTGVGPLYRIPNRLKDYCRYMEELLAKVL